MQDLAKGSFLSEQKFRLLDKLGASFSFSFCLLPFCFPKVGCMHTNHDPLTSSFITAGFHTYLSMAPNTAATARAPNCLARLRGENLSFRPAPAPPAGGGGARARATAASAASAAAQQMLSEDTVTFTADGILTVPAERWFASGPMGGRGRLVVTVGPGDLPDWVGPRLQVPLTCELGVKITRNMVRCFRGRVAFALVRAIGPDPDVCAAVAGALPRRSPLRTRRWSRAHRWTTPR